ncbi:MAG: zf-HC2 domain-containing protein [Saccharopolyspora sp.]|uniref:zf-HC2 domain-containing protein n=1 Tax=Saccharopolyspora TaxID=1835 RepID=UPI001909EBC8|nr:MULTISPECIES: zf-HC2 domain-containing protein [unclassified Saccharopolyspora]MBK0870580.1 zf-HC2 domain-containing protein [Saccharopolyspora sp. HNM0986]MBQ6641115.1 zf-HC2 domain-containing protein [Saccharopolyspora sp.]
MTGRRGWGLPEQHLALDALVAFVDGELSANAHDRAAAHLARCPACAADATAQRQARAAVQSAGAPSVSPGLLQALQSIPSNAELPAQPDGLALTEDGQLVTVDPSARRGRFGSGAALGSSTPLGGGQQPLGSSTPLGETGLDSRGQARPGRGRRTGAGVVFSSLVLGALALVSMPDEQGPPPAVGPLPHPGGAYDSALIPASTGLRTPPPPPAPSLAAVPGPGTSSIPAGRPAMSASVQP